MKAIIITGSTRGIGFGLAMELLKLGHKLIINGRNESSLEKALIELSEISRDVFGIAGDVSKAITHKALLQLAKEHFGKIDIYINNAGIPQGHQSFINLQKENIEKLININIYGLMLGTQVATHFMLEQGHGRIFNMEGFGSDGRTMDKLTLYGTSKRAVQYFTKSMAKELKETCVNIGAVNPGMVRTDFLEVSMTEGSEKDKKQFNKVKRIMAEDVSTVVPVLVKKILNSRKKYEKITYLTPTKLFIKITKLILS